MSYYLNIGNDIQFVHNSGERTAAARCYREVDAAEAVRLLNQAKTANDKRQYTVSARLNCKAEAIRGFQWLQAFKV